MCLIVDVNIVLNVFQANTDEEQHADFRPIYLALFQARRGTVPAKLVYGGHLRKEYERIVSIRPLLTALDRAGRVRVISDDEVDAEQVVVEEMKCCKSNDTHIIALARVANVRLLCSRDQALHTDFGNKELLDNPRGKVYQKATHKRLIKELCQ